MDKKFLEGKKDLTEHETTLNERLIARTEHDMQEVENKILEQDKEQIIGNSFTTAIKQEIYNYLVWASEELTEEELQDKGIFEKLLNYCDSNIIEAITDTYFKIRHPERFNIFYNYDDVLTIIEETARLKFLEKEGNN